MHASCANLAPGKGEWNSNVRVCRFSVPNQKEIRNKRECVQTSFSTSNIRENRSLRKIMTHGFSEPRKLGVEFAGTRIPLFLFLRRFYIISCLDIEAKSPIYRVIAWEIQAGPMTRDPRSVRSIKLGVVFRRKLNEWCLLFTSDFKQETDQNMNFGIIAENEFSEHVSLD